MTVKLNGRAYDHAKQLIEEGKFVDDEREAWSDHHPSTQTENQFIEKNGFFEYGKWFLVVNDEYREDSRRYYELPYGKRPSLRYRRRTRPGWSGQKLRRQRGNGRSTFYN